MNRFLSTEVPGSARIDRLLGRHPVVTLWAGIVIGGLTSAATVVAHNAGLV